MRSYSIMEIMLLIGLTIRKYLLLKIYQSSVVEAKKGLAFVFRKVFEMI